MNVKKQSGFSLIELLIVVAIIGIIAAIAVPNLLAARRSANDASAQQSLRNIHSAQAVYESGIGAGNYTANLAVLGGGASSTEVGLIDSTVVNASNGTPKSGFLIRSIGTSPKSTSTAATYSMIEAPSALSGITRSGNRQFFINESGVITDSGNSSVPPTSTSPPIGN